MSAEGEGTGKPGKAPEFVLPEPDYSPPPLPPGFPRWKHFAWDGWDVEIPVDWDLGALENGPKGGYFRLDDEFEPRLMVRWQPVKGQFDPEKAIERHFKKQFGNSKLPASPVIGAPLPGLRKAFRKLAYKTYALELGEGRSVGLAAHCPECGKAIIAELRTEEGGAGERLIRRVLGSLHDHAGGKLARWEVFGLSMDMPAELRAVAHKFNQGYVHLAASAPGARLEISRWTFANAHLAGTDLRKFLYAHLSKKRGNPIMRIEEAAVQSHPGCAFHSKKRLLEPVRARLRKALAVRNPAYRTGFIWHCTASNRIFMLALGSNRPADTGEARLHASRVRCCKVIY